MKAALIVAGSLLCACAWHANAQTTTTNPTTAVQPDALTSEGPDMSGNSMSGSRNVTNGKTRADVYQELVRSQQDGEAAQLQSVFKGSR